MTYRKTRRSKETLAKMRAGKDRAMLETKLGERDSVTLDAIKRGDSWGDLAQYAKTDSENQELADLSDEFEAFGESMQESDDAWGDE